MTDTTNNPRGAGYGNYITNGAVLQQYVAYQDLPIGALVEIATREAVTGDDLTQLRASVLARMVEEADRDAEARTQTLRLHLAVVRQLHRYLRGERPGLLPFGRNIGTGGSGAGGIGAGGGERHER